MKNRQTTHDNDWIKWFEYAVVIIFLISAFGLFLSQMNRSIPQEIAPQTESITAYAFAMPNTGWAPLTVYFSPYGTTASGATIVRYEWDLDGNGTFETDATNHQGYASYTYSKARDLTISLRVTDQAGNTAVAETTVNVRHPASSSVDYGTVFDDTQVRRVELMLTQDNWNAMWEDPAEKVQVKADAVVFGRRIQEAGLSTKGNSTLWFPGDKKPLKLDINAYLPDQEYKNLKMLLFHNNFGDPSMLREKMSYDLMRFAGVAASHVTYVELWMDVVDDTSPPTYVGVYTMVERPDKKYLANRFGNQNDDGNLYKADAWFEEGAADLAYYGEAISAYPKPRGELAYRLMYKEKKDYTDIIQLCKVIDGTQYASPEEFSSALEEVFNVDGFLRYLAVIFLTLNFDQYPDTGNNYYIYHHPGTDQFEWVAWDMNNSWGNFGGGAQYPIYRTGPSIGPLESAPLYEKVIEVPAYQRAYEAYLDLLIRNRFNATYISAEAERLQTIIRPYLEKEQGDQMYFGSEAPSSLAEFSQSREDIIQLTEQRAAYVSDILENNENHQLP